MLLNYHSHIVSRALAQCDYILRGDKKAKSKIKEIDQWLLEQTKPKNFNPSDVNNDVYKLQQSFEGLCANIEDLGVKDVYNLTVYRFYSRVRYYKKKHSKSRNKAE